MTCTAPIVKTVRLPRRQGEELFITITLPADGDVDDLFAASQRVIGEAGATIIAQDLFGLPAPADADWPVASLTSDPAGALRGMQIHAVSGAEVQRLRLGGRVVGSVFDDGFARHCRLGGVVPPDSAQPVSQQAWTTFELLEEALRLAGMDFRHVARTWFYLDRILDWYGPFNKVRDQYFRERNVFAGVVPASTGIGAANAAGTAVIADAHAIQPRQASVRLQPVPSPLQCPALDYGSSFSRAVEMTAPDHQRLWISGTASIEPGGNTKHIGDPARQIELTMEVVAAILKSRQLQWTDTSRAIAYLKSAAYAEPFAAYCAAHRLNGLPWVVTENDVCRDDLLFEIELDAVRPR